MKKSVCISVFPKEMPLDEVFALAQRLGLDGVELDYGVGCRLTPEMSDDELAEIKSLADSFKIRIPSVSSDFYWLCSLTSDDPEERERAEAWVKCQLRAANKVGADTILVVPGFTGVDFIENCPVVEYDKAYDRAKAWLSRLEVEARKQKVCIAIENVWNKFLLSPLEMRDIIDEVGSPYVGVYFDVGNALAQSYPEHWIKILGNRIKKVHFKDYKRSIGTVDGFVELLEGDIDYKAVMKAFHDIAYNDFVTAEYGPAAESSDTEEYIRDLTKRMDKILSM